MSPKIVDVDEKKKQITDAAIRVLPRKGLKETKMEDVAEAAGIGKGTLYEYFKSKDELFLVAYRHIMEEFECQTDLKLPENVTTIDTLKAIISMMTSMHTSDFPLDHFQVLTEFWLEEVKSANQGKKRQFDMLATYREYIDLVKAVFEQGIQKGEIRDINPEHAATILMMIFDGLMLLWMLDKNSFDFKGTVDTFGGIFIKGIQKQG